MFAFFFRFLAFVSGGTLAAWQWQCTLLIAGFLLSVSAMVAAASPAINMFVRWRYPESQRVATIGGWRDVLAGNGKASTMLCLSAILAVVGVGLMFISYVTR